MKAERAGGTCTRLEGCECVSVSLPPRPQWADFADARREFD